MAVTALIGRKSGMTSVFDEDGAMVGVTVIEFPQNRVVGRRTTDRDGYEAVVLGSAVYMKRWRGDARHFLRSHAQLLGHRADDIDRGVRVARLAKALLDE